MADGSPSPFEAGPSRPPATPAPVARKDDNSDKKVVKQSPKRPFAPEDLALLFVTPNYRTPINRSRRLKRKVIALVGALSCLLVGMHHRFSMNVAHWLPRTLERTHPNLFARLQAALGLIIQREDGTHERVFHLDSSGNQDVVNGFHHPSFDGDGVGSGIWSIVPVELLKCLDRIRNNHHMSCRQWFPERHYLYRLHVYDQESLALFHCGPKLRSYSHLPSEAPTAEELEAEDIEFSQQDGPDDEDQSPLIGEKDIPPNCATSSTDTSTTFRMITPKSRSDWIMRSHLNPAIVIADVVLKLRYRVELLGDENKLAKKDLELYRLIWPTVQYWLEDVDPAGPNLQASIADAFENGPRRSERNKTAKTEPLAKAERLVSLAKKRKAAASAPVIAPAQASSSRNKRASGKRTTQRSSTVDSSKPRPGPRADEQATEGEPERKRRKLARFGKD
ncbi:hypothetical protein BD626DRAFT_584644 [Schizophyllum amplum]|uniref:Uncharacterized protein n=1 Tax=Schizophyllum amplum TaxID=97359 RepID=A0A550C911_9AGAR|nr:hypothetical protein BD626DRAFT_584644 [Auriculariopsis ampla]